jgi:septal ring factor EnvC (AmiA/AmiB activator)
MNLPPPNKPHPDGLGHQLESVAEEVDDVSQELRGAAERARSLEQIVRLRQPSLDKLQRDVADLKRGHEQLKDEVEESHEDHDRPKPTEDP